MDIVLIAVTLINTFILLAVLVTVRNPKNASSNAETIKNSLMRDIQEQLSQLRSELSRNNTEGITTLARMLNESNINNFKQQNETVRTSLEAIQKQLGQFEQRLGNFASENALSLENIRKTVDMNLRSMREDNNAKLDEMRKTVDEKLQSELQKRMRESFAQVSELMERLQRDIGSMRTLADDVGGLKKSLTNIKTRGMMGEFQLENILRDVFAPSQYEKNAHTSPNNPNKVVEFALKIPTEDDSFVYLPIDSKFPQDNYQAVVNAAEAGDKVMLDNAVKQYKAELKRCAAEIRKYIDPPYTTDYAIMFLPTESMYSDAVNHGMLEELWKTSHVYITGPSTVAALLSSMQLSFNNLAIRKRANEVFNVLMEVQTEFNKYADALNKMQHHLRQTDEDLSALIGTRTKAMQRKLSKISQVALSEPTPVLPPAEE